MKSIEKRRPVWNALSEFYLDTELSDNDIDRIITVFKKSGYTLQELEKIDLLEVFPLLRSNLLSIGGVWQGFDETWINQHCELLYHKRNSKLHNIFCSILDRIFRNIRKSHWKKVKMRWDNSFL
jgi:hypothetical protein